MKSRASLSLVVAIFAMVGGAFAGFALKPHILMAKTQAQLDLASALPVQFGGWRLLPSVRLVEPTGSDTLSHEIYNQELARAYVNAEGRIVMLLVAYGESQSERLQLHRPEVCYTAQGFSVSNLTGAYLSYNASKPPIATIRLLTRREERIEPITYWMRIGYDVSEGLLERQRLKLEYGLRGLIPDGALFRVSTIGSSGNDAYMLEDRFILDLLSAVEPDVRAFMVGSPDHAFIARASL